MITQLLLSLFLILFLLVGCQSTKGKNCAGCAYDVFLWKTAVGTIALANFPEEEFNAVVHYADYSNAWVTTGNEINITANLLHELSKEQRVAVAAHEIAHLKAGQRGRGMHRAGSLYNRLYNRDGEEGEGEMEREREGGREKGGEICIICL